MSTLMPSKPSEPAKWISLSKCPVVTNERRVPQHVRGTKVLMLKLPAERNEEVPDMTISMAAIWRTTMTA